MAISTALRTIVDTVVFLLRTAIMACYETTALCAMIIVWVLSAYCALAISWLSPAFCTTIEAVAQALRFVVCIVPLFLASELVRYVISDYKAVVAVVSVDVRAKVAIGVAIGSVPWISLWLLSCIDDLFGHTIGIARGISLLFRRL